jgi:arginine/serine-rich splicing factor 2
MTSLRVANLPFKIQRDDLREMFEKYGDIGDIFLPTDRETGRPRGFAFVRFHDKKDAEDALDALNERSFDGREMRISIDEGRPGGNRGGRDGGGRGGYRGGDRRDDRGGDRRDDRGGDRRRERSRSGGRRSRSRSGGRDRRNRSDSRDRKDTRRKDSSRSKSRS